MKGLTPKETMVVGVLGVGFLCGVSIKILQDDWKPVAVAGPQISSDSTGTLLSEPVQLMMRLNLNSASKEQLESLPGIGPVTAEKIINYREEHGPFGTIKSLESIKGIGPKTVQKLMSLIYIEDNQREVTGNAYTQVGRRSNGRKSQR
ncbi:ComEA family DNA-binding protein [bacterium]|nr:ComEA family DNA-binding protein [bacterium]